jgi:heat shock protein HslJ
MKRITLLLSLIILTLLLVACGGEEPTPTLAPTAEPVEEPTQAPEVEPTEEPTQAPAAEVEPTPASPLESMEFVVDPQLIDVIWQWEKRTNNGGGEAIITVPDLSQYTVLFNDDGTFNAQIDCNSGSGNYATDGTGSIFMELGPMTLAACEPGSLDQDMINMFGPAQSYVYEEEGQVVIFKWVAGGPWDYYRRSDSTGTEAVSSDSDIVGVTWLWQEFQDTAELNDVTVPNPENYTLTLLPDGTAAIQADCNQVSWTYTLDSSPDSNTGSLSFNTLGPSTLAFCGEDSLDQQYLAWLGDTATYVTQDGQLFLNLIADAGNMVFGQKSSAAIDPSRINLDAQGLSEDWQAVIVPETPYDQSQPPGPMGLPEHTQILFGISDPAEREFFDPVMYLIPVNAYRQLWEEAGNSSISSAIDNIEQLALFPTQETPTSGLPALPFEAGVAGFNDLAVQFSRFHSAGELNETSATQNGYRFVGRWNQDANPVTNQGLRYIYQGFTNDGEYLVSFWYPVSTSELPADASQVPAEELEQFNNDFEAYMASQVEKLNALSTEQWEPDLATLDALVASLQIEDIPVAGIQDKSWLWTEGPSEPGGSEIVTIEDPARYEVVYSSEGTINFVADCNSGNMGYELRNGGMAGGMLASAGPMTLAECEPGSYYQSFINSLLAAQDYMVRAGGDDLELILPAGGGTLFLRNAAAQRASDDGQDGGGDGDSEESESFFPSNIQMDLQLLADTFAWEVVDASPIPPGPGGQGFPRHIVLGFDGEDPLEVPYTERRIMYIFPVEAYINLYEANGSDVVTQQVARLEELIATAENRQGIPDGFMPLLPPPNSLMERWVQFADLNFVDGEGVRYVSDSPLRQSIGVWTNETMDYYYQGLTEDDRFYVSLKWPVATSVLPNTVNDASEEDIQAASESRESYDAYESALKAELNALGSSEWEPDLALLDAMVASLTLETQ